MRLPRFLRLVACHKGLACGVFISSQFIFWGMWLNASHYYKADALVLFEKTGMEPNTVTDARDQYNLADKVALLTSHLVADRVIKRLQLDEALLPAWEALPDRSRLSLSYQDWLYLVLTSGLVPSRASSPYLLSVGYASPSPDMAATLANAYATELQEVIAQLGRRDQATAAAVMDLAAKNARIRMSDLQREVLGMNHVDGILLPGLEDDAHRGALQAGRQAGGSQMSAIEADVTQAVVGHLKERGALLDDQTIADLKAELGSLEVEQAGTLVRLGANHPAVKALESRIEALQRKVSQQESARVQSVAALADIDQRTAVANEDAASQASRRVLASLSQRGHFDTASEQVSDAGDSLADALTQAQVTSLLSDAPTVDVRILKGATVPVTIWLPRPEIVISVSVMTGVLFMILATWFSERFSTRVRDVAQLYDVLGQDVIGYFNPDSDRRSASVH